MQAPAAYAPTYYFDVPLTSLNVFFLLVLLVSASQYWPVLGLSPCLGIRDYFSKLVIKNSKINYAQCIIFGSSNSAAPKELWLLIIFQYLTRNFE